MAKSPTQSQQKSGKKRTVFAFLILLVLGLVLRMYRINTPLADFHSWRQADTSAVTRNFVKDGVNLLSPRYDDLSSIQSGLDNPNGYRMVEFPIYNATAALTYPVVSSFLPLEQWERIMTIVAWAITLFVIFSFMLTEYNLVAAICTGLFYATLPFIVFFTRVVLPDPTATMCTFVGLYTLYTFGKQKNTYARLGIALLSGVFFALGLLIKPTVIFFGLSFLFLFARNLRLSMFKKFDFYLFSMVSFVPLFLWRQYIAQFPEGIPSSLWLITSVNTPEGMQRIFFKPAFFRWIFFERINNIILGGFSTIFLVLGSIVKTKKWFLHSLLASSLLYVFTFQGGNVQHEYYQILILPVIAMTAGLGMSYVLNRKIESNYILALILTLGLYVSSLFFSYYQIKGYYNYSEELVTIAKIVKTLTTPQDHIVTDTTGDTTLLYLMDRKGAPATFRDLTELKREGYDYFVTQKQDVIAEIKRTKVHTLVFENDRFALFSL